MKKTIYSLNTLFIYMAAFSCSGFAETNCPGLGCVGVQLPPIVIADDYDPKDMLSTGKISSANGRPKKLNEPDYNSIKACSREPQGLVGTWDNKTLMYRAKIKGNEGILIADTFLPDSKVDELEKKHKKDCVFKTSINGKDAFFNILGEGKDRMVSFMASSPNVLCENVALYRPTEAQSRKSLADLREDLRASISGIIENFKEESSERKRNMVNKSMTTQDYEKFKEALNGCLNGYKSISDTKYQDMEKAIAMAERDYKFNNSMAMFPESNSGVGGKIITNLELGKPYAEELNSCVENLPLNKSINTLGENIVFTAFNEKGQEFYFKGNDNQYYSISRAAISWKGPGVCTGAIDGSRESCITHTKTTLPNGQVVGIDLTVSKTKQADGGFKQNQEVNFTNFLAGNVEYHAIEAMKKVDEREAVSAMVIDVQQAMSNYPQDFTYHGANNISKETRELFNQSFADCKKFLNSVAPSEKEWNDFAYNTSQGITNNRATASKDDGGSAAISK